MDSVGWENSNLLHVCSPIRQSS